MNKKLSLFLLSLLMACAHAKKETPLEKKAALLFKENPEYIAKSFDYPVGKPNYYS